MGAKLVCFFRYLLVIAMLTSALTLKNSQIRAVAISHVRKRIQTRMSSETPTWTPPAKIEELFSKTAGNQFAAINAPTAGARTQVDLPRGPAPIQLYSLGTPNGIKVSILLEELEELGLTQYDAHIINIGKGDQFGSGFVQGNPNSKIPMAIDYAVDGEPIRIFESASIVQYFAEKFGRFIPSDPRLRVEMNNWIFWQMAGQGPITGNFGHFFVYAPGDKAEARDYGVARYGMDTVSSVTVNSVKYFPSYSFSQYICSFDSLMYWKSIWRASSICLVTTIVSWI